MTEETRREFYLLFELYPVKNKRSLKHMLATFLLHYHLFFPIAMGQPNTIGTIPLGLSHNSLCQPLVRSPLHIDLPLGTNILGVLVQCDIFPEEGSRQESTAFRLSVCGEG